MSIEDAFEQIFHYYRSDENIRAIFAGESLSIVLKFLDTKRTFNINIHEDQEILLDSNTPLKKPDVLVRIRSEQILLDLINGEIPVAEPFAKGKIIIVKGFTKIARLYRKYVK